MRIKMTDGRVGAIRPGGDMKKMAPHTRTGIRTAVLWTGGKDCALALHLSLERGLQVACLVTFAPPDPQFLAHPLSVMKLQAQALRLPHHVVTVTPPLQAGYESALRQLRAELGIHCIVTGDIDEVDGQPNWIRACCCATGMDAQLPLWTCDRETAFAQMCTRGIRARISCVDTRKLNAAWVGRELTTATVAELRSVCADAGLDLCGEAGEYHTLVVDSTLYSAPIEIRSCTTRTTGPYAYLDIREATLADRRG